MSNVKVQSVKPGSNKIYELPKQKADALVLGGTHKIVTSGVAINAKPKNVVKKATDMTSKK